MHSARCCQHRRGISFHWRYRRNHRMTRNRETGKTLPSDVNFTLADSIFSDEQNRHIWDIAQHMETLDVRLLDGLIHFGKTLEAWLSGHPLEDMARRVLLAPLHRDGVALAKLLRQVQTRLLMSAPAKSQAQFDAAMQLQLQDAGAAVAECQREHHTTDDAASIAQAKEMAAAAYMALCHSQAAIGAALDAARYRKEQGGHITAAEKSACTAMRAAGKKNDAALDALRVWRHAQAMREEGQAEPAA